MPRKKQDLFEKKLNIINGGITNKINITNRNQLKKINKLEIEEHTIEQVPLHKVYMRRKNVWVYKGLCCRYCDSMMTDPIVIDKHRYVCKEINKNSE